MTDDSQLHRPDGRVYGVIRRCRKHRIIGVAIYQRMVSGVYPG